MAIVYLLISLTASPSHPAFVHLEAYHQYAERNELEVPCEEYIKQDGPAAIREDFGLPAEGLSLQCVSAEEGMRIAKSIPAPKPQTRSMKGRLIYEPLDSGRKSVAAYLGHEFFLQTDGQKVPLRPGTVTEAQLKALKGKMVEISGEYVEEAANPEAQTPMQSDGTLMRRKYWKVNRITPLR